MEKTKPTQLKQAALGRVSSFDGKYPATIMSPSLGLLRLERGRSPKVAPLARPRWVLLLALLDECDGDLQGGSVRPRRVKLSVPDLAQDALDDTRR